MGAMVSPLTGADGNVEFLVHARTAEPVRTAAVDRTVDRAGLIDTALEEAAAQAAR
jgi:hypothetical protein